MANKKINKVCLVVTKGTLDMAYPPLMIAAGAAAAGSEVHVFCTFWGLNLLKKGGAESLQISRTLEYVEEAEGYPHVRVAQRSQVVSLGRCSRPGVRNAG